MSDRHRWVPAQHEAAVERFYGTGIDWFHDYHGGYLNFGYWTREGMTYEEAAEALVRRVGEHLGLGLESALLDVGCGMGSQDVFLWRAFQPRSIDGLDVTWKHVACARERAQRAGLPANRVRFHHGTATALPFPDQQFTHLLSIEAPEHFDTREDFFREAHRVLQPGGVIVACDYGLARTPRTMAERVLVEAARRLWQVPRANIYGNDTYRAKLEAAGFTNVTIENVGAWTIPGYYAEHRRPEAVRAVRAVRGFWKGVVGGWCIDAGVYHAYRKGLCEYLIVRAVRS